jgi:serine/threonine protein kinase
MFDANYIPKICDWGLANGSRGCGTNRYIAPEIFSLDRKIDDKLVDAWAVGLVIYYIYKKVLPFSEEDLNYLRNN